MTSVESVLKQAEGINKRIVEHNNANRKNEGIREATKNSLVEQLNEFNALYGTNLSLDNMEELQKVYVDSVKDIHANSKHLEEVLKAVDENDIKKVTALTGINIEEDIIKLPRIDIDMDEMEKHAEKAYKQTLESANQSNNLMGYSEPEVIQSIGDEEDENSIQEVPFAGVQIELPEEEEEEGISFTPQETNAQQGVRAIFDANLGNKPSEPKEEQPTSAPINFGNFGQVKQEETVEESKPLDFSSMTFGDSKQEEKQEEPATNPAPAFGFNFGVSNEEEQKPAPVNKPFNFAVEEEPKEEKKEETNINSFLQNFNEQNQNKPNPSDAKLEDALKNQSAPPTFNFNADIDVD